jgi:membrane-associated phospholipid phosphatase
MTSTPSRARWTAALLARIQRHFVVKALGTTLAIGLFFVFYFQLLHHPLFPVSTMPETALDRLIPFRPEWLIAYLTLWLYVGVGPGLQRDASDLLNYACWVGLLCATGLLIFLFWPTQIPPHPIDVAHSPGFALLQGVDAAGNACPSMHVAIAIFTMLRLQDVWQRIRAPLLLRAASLLWCAAIVLSTLVTKQHVVLDVIAGGVLGAAFAALSLRWVTLQPRWRIARQT